MIKSFRHKGLERFFRTGSKAGIQAHHANRLRIMLTRLDVSRRPEDMDAQPVGVVWVNGNWRLTFQFDGEDVELVDYQDYH